MKGFLPSTPENQVDTVSRSRSFSTMAVTSKMKNGSSRYMRVIIIFLQKELVKNLIS